MKINSIKLDKPLDEILKGRIQPYSFEVGILQDKAHRIPSYRKKVYAGMEVQAVFGRVNGTNATVSAEARKKLGVNYLVEPWKKKSDDAVKMLKAFFELCFGEGKLSKKKRLENLIQAIVRNPLLRADYGRNRFPKWHPELGGKRKPKFIATAQLFRGITAKVRINSKGGR